MSSSAEFQNEKHDFGNMLLLDEVFKSPNFSHGTLPNPPTDSRRFMNGLYTGQEGQLHCTEAQVTSFMIDSVEQLLSFKRDVLGHQVQLMDAHLIREPEPADSELDTFARDFKIQHTTIKTALPKINSFNSFNKLPSLCLYGAKPSKLKKEAVAKPDKSEVPKRTSLTSPEEVPTFPPDFRSYNYKNLIIHKEPFPSNNLHARKEDSLIVDFTQRRIINNELKDLYQNAVREDTNQIIQINKKDIMNMQDVVFPMKDMYLRMNEGGLLNRLPKTYSCRDKVEVIPMPIG